MRSRYPRCCEDIKVTEVAWQHGIQEGTSSSVIAATVLRLLFCWAFKGPGL